MEKMKDYLGCAAEQKIIKLLQPGGKGIASF
jgi:hypothetical protein